MRLFAFSDNPFFIRYWRERMRPHYVAASALIAVILITLIFISSYANPPHAGYSEGKQYKSIAVPWLNGVFYYISVVQGVWLILFGASSSFRMASMERTSGTIDFHRSSPFPRLQQLLGIVFGAPVLEWVIFLFTLCLSFIIALLAGIKLQVFLIFYASLMVCAVFFHSIAAAAGISAQQKNPRSGFAVFFFFYIFAQLAFWISFSYHATCFPAYEYLHQQVMEAGIPQNVSAWAQDHDFVLHSFFGQRIHFFLYQLLIHFPLGLLAWSALRRKISYAERFVFSKTHSVSLALLVFIYLCGSLVSHLFLSGNSRFQAVSNSFTGLFFYLVILLAVMGAATATPTYLMYTKGLRRAKKLSLKKLSYSEDQASNILWLFVFCLAASTVCLAYLYFAELAWGKRFIILFVLLSQIVTFASALECFRLSRHHQKKIVFWTGVGIIWIASPVFGFITENIIRAKYSLQYFLAPSPFAVTYLVETLSSAHKTAVTFKAPIFIGVNLFLSAVTVYLALGERKRIQEQMREDLPVLKEKNK